MPIAFQDRYAEEFSHCYGCGRNNPHGHRLKSYWHADGERTVARFTADARYSGGVPGHVYGGLIASLLDCHGTASATAFSWRAQGLAVDAMGTSDAIDGAVAALRCVTATLKVDYLRPTPIGVELVVEGALRAIDGRKVWVDLTLSAAGQLCARGEMLAVVLAPRVPAKATHTEPTEATNR